MGIVNVIFGMRKRLSDKEIEKLINIGEDERKRRNLLRDDEVIKSKGFKNV